MPKKKEDTVLDTVLDTVKSEDKVSLEMTKDEAEQFAAFKIKKEAEAALDSVKIEDKEDWLVTLSYSHRINGKKYGPGQTTVPKEIVGHLQSSEQKQLINELKLNQSTKHFFSVTGQGQATKVKNLPQG